MEWFSIEVALLILAGYLLRIFVESFKRGYRKAKFKHEWEKNYANSVKVGVLSPNEAREMGVVNRIPTCLGAYTIYSVEEPTTTLYKMSDGSLRWELPVFTKMKHPDDK